LSLRPEATPRQEFEEKIACSQIEIAKCESPLRDKQAAISAEGSKSAAFPPGNEIKHKADEIANLRAVRKHRDAKLAKARKARPELLRKQRKLDDAKPVMKLHIEKQVQAGLAIVRDTGRRNANNAETTAHDVPSCQRYLLMCHWSSIFTTGETEERGGFSLWS
jgi:hypothetical protein